MRKLDLEHGERVRIKGTNSSMDGSEVKVVGVAVRNIVDIYIVTFYSEVTFKLADGMKVSAFVMPEVCLERVL
jgi:hypothetical protein